MLWPGFNTINNFPPLPESVKSTEEGDTIQVPNVAAYFSNSFRKMVIAYYQEQYLLNGLPLLPWRLNYPPEYAYTAIKDQTRSTYLEELIFPLRDSLFINGYEPFYEDGKPRFRGATNIVIGDKFFNTKTNLRFYPSPIWVRVIVWMGVNLSLILLWKMSKEVLKR